MSETTPQAKKEETLTRDATAYVHENLLLIDDIEGDSINICCMVNSVDTSALFKVTTLCSSTAYNDIDYSYDVSAQLLTVVFFKYTGASRKSEMKDDNFTFPALRGNLDIQFVTREDDGSNSGPLTYGKKQKHTIAYSNTREKHNKN